MFRRSPRSSTIAKTAATDARVSILANKKARRLGINKEYLLVDPPSREWVGDARFVLARLITPLRFCPIIDEVEFCFSTYWVTSRACVYRPLVDLATELGLPCHANFHHYTAVITKGSATVWERLQIPETSVSADWWDIELVSFVPSYERKVAILKDAATLEAAIDAMWRAPEFRMLHAVISAAFRARVPKSHQFATQRTIADCRSAPG